MLIENGTKVNKGYWGPHLVYSRPIEGTTLNIDIRLTNSTIRLINPLVNPANNWEGQVTSVMVDWGDGTVDRMDGKLINSARFNRTSTDTVTHTYMGVTGDSYTIKITGIEPLLPINCNIIKLWGSFPEDRYDKNANGLLGYDPADLTLYPELSDLVAHKNTIVELGSELLDNWVNTFTMDNMFSGWVVLAKLGPDFFKENILNICTSYKNTFKDTTLLLDVDYELLGTVNNTVQYLDNMFENSGVENVLNLVSSTSLLSINQSYKNAVNLRNVTVTAFSDCPALLTARETFVNCNELVSSYPTQFLLGSINLQDIYGMLRNTSVTATLPTIGNLLGLENATYAYADCHKLSLIRNESFSNVANGGSVTDKLDISYMFYNSGDPDTGIIIQPDTFKNLSVGTSRLKSVQTGIFEKAIINNLDSGLFDSLFQDTTPRFELIDTFKSATFIANNGYVEIPNIFPGCNGVKTMQNVFSDIKIGYINRHMLEAMIGLESVQGLVEDSIINCRIPEDLCATNKAIVNYRAMFKNIDYKFKDLYPIDYIVRSNAPNIDMTEMYSGDMLVYRPIHWSCTSANITVDNLYTNTQSVPIEFILNGRTNATGWTKSYSARPMIYDIFATQNVTMSIKPFKTLTVAQDITINWGDGNTETLQSVGPISHTYNAKGHYRLEITTTDAWTVNETEGVKIIRMTGEYPYNSQPDKPSSNSVRFIDRFVYSICDQNNLHAYNTSKFNGYTFHPQLLKYHSDITETYFMYNLEEDISSLTVLWPNFYQNLAGLTSGKHLFDVYNRVLSDRHLPNTLLNSSLDMTNGIMTDVDPVIQNYEKYKFHNIHAIDGWDDRTYTITNKSRTLGYARTHIPIGSTYNFPIETEEYLEFKVQLGSSTEIRLEPLIDDIEPTGNIKVQIYEQDSRTPIEMVLTSLGSIGIFNDSCIIRVYANQPVWLDCHEQITELYGVIPRADLTNVRFNSKCTNVTMIGELIVIRATNTVFDEVFSDLKFLEYVPETLFAYNWKANSFRFCFSNCVSLFKVGDGLIADKDFDVDCTGMFSGCNSVEWVNKPICDSVTGRVNITDMFIGAKTRFWYKPNSTPDAQMWYNLDTKGESGLTYTQDINVVNNDKVLICSNIDDAINNLKVSMSYFVASDITSLGGGFHSDILRFASTALEGQSLNLHTDNNELYETLKYLPFLRHVRHTDGYDDPIKGENQFFYNERLYTVLSCFQCNIFMPFPNWLYLRTNDIITMEGSYQDMAVQADTAYPIEFFPVDCSVLYNISNMANGMTMNFPQSLIIPKSIIHRADYAFSNINFDLGANLWDNLDIDSPAIYMPSDNERHCGLIPYLYYNATGVQTDTGVFKKFGAKLHPLATSHVYEGTHLATPDVNAFDNCEHMTHLNYIYSKSKLHSLPTINHMNNLTQMQHYASETNLTDLPENYIKSFSPTLDISYAFSKCRSIFLNNKFIDPATSGFITINYSLEDVITNIGGDANIFAGLNYDTEYTRRSRVTEFDETKTFSQRIVVTVPNTTVTVKGINRANLVGVSFTEMTILNFGDSSAPDSVRNISGRPLTNDDITFTYATPGIYDLYFTNTEDNLYVQTPEQTIGTLYTSALLTRFKNIRFTQLNHGNLYHFFGTQVESIADNPFELLPDIGTETSIYNLFYGFKKLKTFPLNCLKGFSNVQYISRLLADSLDITGNTNIIVPSWLFEDTVLLASLEGTFTNSNIKEIEQGTLDKLANLRTVYEFAKSCPYLDTVPLDLIAKNTNLNTANYMFFDCPKLVIDETWKDFFINNTAIRYAAHAFNGCIIKGLHPDMLASLTELSNAMRMFSAGGETYLGTDPDELATNPIQTDPNTWSIPTGFLRNNVKINTASAMFAGRKSCIGYPSDLLDNLDNEFFNIALEKMLCNTSIKVIHDNTFKVGKSNTEWNCEYMFANTDVHGINAPFRNSFNLPVVRTKGMFKKCYGYVEESEIFRVVNTNPVPPDSMYKIEKAPFILDATIPAGTTVYARMPAPDSFPVDAMITIDWDDGNITAFDGTIIDANHLKTLTAHTYANTGAYSIKLQLPYVSLIASDSIDLSFDRATGALGNFPRNVVPQSFFQAYGLRSIKLIEGSSFMLYNKDVTSLQYFFYGLIELEYIGSDVLKHCTKVTNINYLCGSCSKLKIKSGYQLDFSYMPLITSALGVYQNCQSFAPDTEHNYNPLITNSNITTIAYFYYNSGIKKMSRFNADSLTTIGYLAHSCPDLESVDVDFLVTSTGKTQIVNYTQVFANCPKFKNIIGETDTRSLFSEEFIMPAQLYSVELGQAFNGTALSQQSIIRIINNLGAAKHDGSFLLYTDGMFSYIDTRNTPEGNLTLKMNLMNKRVNAGNMFLNTYLTKITNQSVRLDKNDSNYYTFNYGGMFRNCYAQPEVNKVEDAFYWVDVASTDEDYRISGLNVLNSITSTWTTGTRDDSIPLVAIPLSDEEFTKDI